MNKELGKIERVEVGMGGYEDAMFGVSFVLGGKGWGVGDFWGTWANRNEEAKWTVKEQSEVFAETSRRLIKLLEKAQVQTVGELKGKPVEATFEDQRLKSWRLLDEVL